MPSCCKLYLCFQPIDLLIAQNVIKKQTPASYESCFCFFFCCSSLERNLPGDNVQGEQFTGRQFPLGGNSPRGNLPRGNLLRNNYARDSSLGGAIFHEEIVLGKIQQCTVLLSLEHPWILKGICLKCYLAPKYSKSVNSEMYNSAKRISFVKF